MPDVKLDRLAISHLDPYKLVPHGDRYLVELLDADADIIVKREDGSTGKVYLPENTSTEEMAGFYWARIIAAGSGHRLEANVVVPMPHQAGDIVMIEKYSGREIQLGLKKYRIVNQIDVVGWARELSPSRYPTMNDVWIKPFDSDFDREQIV